MDPAGVRATMDNAVLVVAHPDDEALWFSSVLGSVRQLIVCFVDHDRNPRLGPARRRALARHPIPHRALGLSEPGTFNTVDWTAAVETESGLELRGADEPTASRYRHNATALHGLLSEAVRPYANIITHNPWGEYGHPDHVQVHRVLSSIANRLGRPLWFSNYVSHVSLPLHLRYVSGFNRHYISRPTDVELGRRIAEIYRAERCWTWYDDFEWFDQDTFVDAAVPAAARTSGADKLYGSLCPLNLIRVSPASDVGLAAPRRRSLLRSLLRVAPDRPDRRETPAPARD